MNGLADEADKILNLIDKLKSKLNVTTEHFYIDIEKCFDSQIISIDHVETSGFYDNISFYKSDWEEIKNGVDKLLGENQ